MYVRPYVVTGCLKVNVATDLSSFDFELFIGDRCIAFKTGVLYRCFGDWIAINRSWRIKPHKKGILM
jgi:hypothetical protein